MARSADPGRLAGLDEKAKELYENRQMHRFSPGVYFATIGYLMDWAPFYRAVYLTNP